MDTSRVYILFVLIAVSGANRRREQLNAFAWRTGEIRRRRLISRERLLRFQQVLTGLPPPEGAAGEASRLPLAN